MIKQVLDIPKTSFPITSRMQGVLYCYFKDKEKNECNCNAGEKRKWYIAKCFKPDKKDKFLYDLVPVSNPVNDTLRFAEKYTKEQLLEKMIVFSTTDSRDVKEMFKIIARDL